MCGIFAVANNRESARLSYLGLFALQHRGQESAGIAGVKKGRLVYYNSMGLVNDIFTPEILSSISSESAIGHVRYSTAGSSSVNNAQPLYFNCKYGEIAVAHNGNIVNAQKLRRELVEDGAIFQSDTDSEVIIHLISRSHQKNLDKAIAEKLPLLKGAYSFLFLTKDKIIAARDPHGFRPLVVGKLGDSWVFSSETCCA